MEGGAVVARPQVEQTRTRVELLACVAIARLARPRLLVDGAVGAVAGAGLQAGSPHLPPHTAQCIGQQATALRCGGGVMLNLKDVLVLKKNFLLNQGFHIRQETRPRQESN